MTFVERQCYVAGVANDVDELRVRKIAADSQHVRNVGGRGIDPTVDSLLEGDFFHDVAHEVAAIAAVRHHLGFDVIGFQAGDVERLAAQPFPHHLFFI